MFCFCRWFFRCCFHFVFSHLQSFEAKSRPALVVWGLLGSGDAGGEGAGVSPCGWELLTADLDLAFTHLCCLCSSKSGQGNTRALLRREQGWNYKQMFFDNAEERGPGPETAAFTCWEPLASASVHFSLTRFPGPPEPRCTCCCSPASCQQWHLLSVATEHLNVNIFALKWMEKYLSLSGNHSSNKRLARQGP